MGLYDGKKAKDKTGKATYFGGRWHGPMGNIVQGPKRKYGDNDQRYWYGYDRSKRKVQKRY